MYPLAECGIGGDERITMLEGQADTQIDMHRNKELSLIFQLHIYPCLYLRLCVSVKVFL